MVDNLKSAVLQRLAGCAPVFNPRYLDFARHWGFDIAACAPGRGNEKGRVENAVGYVKKNFLNGLELCDFSAHQPGRADSGSTRWPTCASTARPNAGPSICSRRSSPVCAR